MPSTAQEEGVRRWVLKSQLGLGRLWSLGAVSLAGPSEFKGHHACFHVFQSTGTSQNKCWKGYWSCGIFWDFPGYPVVKTPPFQCRRCKFDPWSGNLNPACAQHDPSKKRKREHLAYFKYLQQLPIEHLPPTPPPLLNFWGCFTSLERVSKVYIQDPQGVADSWLPGLQCPMAHTQLRPDSPIGKAHIVVGTSFLL